MIINFIDITRSASLKCSVWSNSDLPAVGDECRESYKYKGLLSPKKGHKDGPILHVIVYH